VIHIDTQRLGYRLPPSWLKHAALAQDSLDAVQDPAEANEILSNKRLWGKLNSTLRGLSNDKCWYSEVRVAASRMDVDHFRPKGTVLEKDGTTRPGYRFLAYDFKNYRLSAQLMNQTTATDDGTRGKHQQFPLEEGSQPAVNRDGLSAEKPLLLDPTDPTDPKLMTFDEQGLPKPSALAQNDADTERVIRTIDVLWLDRPQLADQRKAGWTKTHNLIELADRLMTKAHSLASNGHHKEAEEEWEYGREQLKQLREEAQPTAQFSASVRACLRASGREWAERIAQRAEHRSLVLVPV
jgi:hypothetical protein